MSNFDTYLNSLVQVDNKECREKILKNVKNIPFSELYQERSKELKKLGCKNEKNDADNNLYEYNLKNIKKNKDGFCKEQNSDITLKKGLTKMLNNEKKCIRFVNKSPKKEHQLFFILKRTPPNDIKNIKEYIMDNLSLSVFYTNKTDDFIGSRQQLISYNILPVLGQHSVYKVDYKGNEKLKTNNFYSVNDLYNFELIYKNNLHEIRDISISNNKLAFKELKKFMEQWGRNFNRKAIEEIEKINLVPKNPIKVYRGLHFDYPCVFTRNYKLGDSFDLYSLGRSMSWTSAFCIANDFSKFSGENYGMVVSTILNPKDILIDTRKIVENEIFELFDTDQQEIITKPYRIDKKTVINEEDEKEIIEILEDLKFSVKIEQLSFDDKDDVMSFKEFEKIKKHVKQGYPKDISIYSDTIGEPLSKSTAISKFFNKDSINMKILPQSQKDLLLLEQQKIVDPITLEEVNLTDCWQFKEDGYIIPIKTALELIEKNTNTWYGKENVGFKNPLSGCIYGNLVYYNYDNNVYFPQGNGELVIKIMDYNKKIVIKKGETIKQFIQLSFRKRDGTYYRFANNGQVVSVYYPYTKEGKKVVMLMIDCFLKKNLFGMDKNGNVMNGRVHKKTVIESTKELPYGYPDENYDVRVCGELYDLGSTPYIVAETELHRYQEGNMIDFFSDIPIEEFFNACVEH